MYQVKAEPYEFEFNKENCALIIIDMQRDFVQEGGFGEALGNDVSFLKSAVAPTKSVLDKFRGLGMAVIHTREGHRPGLEDLYDNKKHRGKKVFIGTDGTMGRILVRGEKGHDIVEELYPLDTEPIIDKLGKGAFYQTDLEAILRVKRIKKLVVCGVTTEVCVHTTVREANDRGFDCLVLSDCVGSYFPEFQRIGLEMIKAQGGIFGWVSDSKNLLDAL